MSKKQGSLGIPVYAAPAISIRTLWGKGDKWYYCGQITFLLYYLLPINRINVISQINTVRPKRISEEDPCLIGDNL